VAGYGLRVRVRVRLNTSRQADPVNYLSKAICLFNAYSTKLVQLPSQNYTIINNGFKKVSLALDEAYPATYSFLLFSFVQMWREFMSFLNELKVRATYNDLCSPPSLAFITRS